MLHPKTVSADYQTKPRILFEQAVPNSYVMNYEVFVVKRVEQKSLTREASSGLESSPSR